MARSMVRDLLGSHPIHVHPISDVLDQLIAAEPSPGIAAATLAAIEQRLLLTYNARTTALVLSFARGFLRMEPQPGSSSLPMPSVPQTEQRQPQPVLPAVGPAPAAPLGLVMVHQWLILLTALGGLALLAAVLIRSLNSPVSRQEVGVAGEARNRSAAPGEAAPQPLPQPARAPGTPPVPSPAAASVDLYDAGLSAGGQRVLLETSSLATTSDPQRIRFRYRLGAQPVASEADCSRMTWTTFPEGETHAPQSAATERLLRRVCESAATPAPAVSSAGAAMVFDPPSNIRVTPNGAILCAITSRSTIAIQGQEGDWYRTDVCGSPGYIHRGQIRF